MKYSVRLCVFWVFIYISTSGVYAQEVLPSGNHNLWISGGLGFTSLKGPAGSANLSFRYKSTLISLRTTANTRAEEKGLIGPVGDDFFDRALIVGFCLRKQDEIVSFGTGVSRVHGSRYDPEGEGGFFSSGEREDFAPLFGVPIEIQYLKLLGRGFGVGLYGYLNVNKEQVFGGITFNLVFGGLQ